MYSICLLSHRTPYAADRRREAQQRPVQMLRRSSRRGRRTQHHPHGIGIALRQRAVQRNARRSKRRRLPRIQRIEQHVVRRHVPQRIAAHLRAQTLYDPAQRAQDRQEHVALRRVHVDAARPVNR